MGPLHATTRDYSNCLYTQHGAISHQHGSPHPTPPPLPHFWHSHQSLRSINCHDIFSTIFPFFFFTLCCFIFFHTVFTFITTFLPPFTLYISFILLLPIPLFFYHPSPLFSFFTRFPASSKFLLPSWICCSLSTIQTTLFLVIVPSLSHFYRHGQYLPFFSLWSQG